jgi:DNA-binding CsgD family transcriptional regulator
MSVPTLGALLGARESEVLHLIAEGMSNKQIGVAMSISEFTVKSHLHNLLRKLGATNRSHAVAIGVRGGWLHLDSIDEITTWEAS